MNNQGKNLEYTLAGNLGNMIGQQALQIAHLQIALKEKNEELTQKDDLIAELKHQVESLQKRGGVNDERQAGTKHQQN
ncbi:hypothetical protein [Lactobacillus crispatus]|uniref:hypothetical protein n=1 Tax=Lactobacillus crispatus TaxID=47770 RepID=UPI000DF8F5D3|nr:hypothetical protein [Lactobacillus crispatus]MCT3533427.1 hypothetical protein [Lactobacillus crispatus]MCZ3990116.1 hypothetical protein [Lactobacillus crispatus]MCZ3992299.1 hypothetical protein [Lactobacillus crispatus]STX15972.1 Uncharacterised protein [Lactobacillus acidophilus]